jgi:hypothetical protein
MTKASKHEHRVNAHAYWQVRILDLGACLERTQIECDPVSFNLRLRDPIARHIDEAAPWTGIAGDYIVTLGPTSSAVPGTGDGLATLHTSVGAFTRLWLGVRPPTGLTWTDELEAPADLLRTLDRSLRLPIPAIDWDF